MPNLNRVMQLHRENFYAREVEQKRQELPIENKEEAETNKRYSSGVRISTSDLKKSRGDGLRRLAHWAEKMRCSPVLRATG